MYSGEHLVFWLKGSILLHLFSQKEVENEKNFINRNRFANRRYRYNNTKKIKNWSEYNKSLKNRGNLSIFISKLLLSC